MVLGTSLFGGGAYSGGGMDWGSSDFATSIAGEATLQAVDQIGSQIEGMVAKIPDNQSLAAANVEGKVAEMQCLPDNLRGRVYYRPTSEGIEKRIRERMEEIKRLRSPGSS